MGMKKLQIELKKTIVGRPIGGRPATAVAIVLPWPLMGTGKRFRISDLRIA